MNPSDRAVRMGNNILDDFGIWIIVIGLGLLGYIFYLMLT